MSRIFRDARLRLKLNWSIGEGKSVIHAPIHSEILHLNLELDFDIKKKKNCAENELVTIDYQTLIGIGVFD